MDAVQGDVVFTVQVAEPKCRCCGAVLTDESDLGDGLCLKHFEMDAFVWRLQKRGDAITVENLVEFMTRRQRPIMFKVEDAPEIFRQYEAAGLLEERLKREH